MESMLSLIPFMGGLVLMFFAYNKFQLRKVVLARTTVKVESLRPGTIELSGVAAADVEMKDPIFGEPSVFYSVKIQERRGFGRTRRWATVFNEQSNGRSFYLEDNTGRVLILPSEPDVYLQKITKSTFLSFGDNSDPYMRFMRSKAMGIGMKISATILRPGDRLYILGMAKPLPKEKKEPSEKPVFFVGDAPDFKLVIARDEEELISTLAWHTLFFTLAGAAVLAFAIILFRKI